MKAVKSDIRIDDYGNGELFFHAYGNKYYTKVNNWIPEEVIMVESFSPLKEAETFLHSIRLCRDPKYRRQ